ncbi:TAXI family TRAP transporter solute-binding subunit [Bradyrhizobium sp. Pha-3]|uniref:TAXI family TRAP transporter solute-binding subunit n=1 Tax=Bradyrhizobium sp. Pha-3 TaxID=208375 RepID=UPI0035D46A1A
MAAKEILGKHLPTVAILVIAAVIAWAAIIVLRNMPPFTIAMATGPEGSAYYQYGQRYREELAKAGVDVRLVTTAGSPENIALLQDPRSGVSVGFIRGGTAGASASRELESLGAVSYQPLWLFHKRELLLADGFMGLRGRKISIGPVDSGTQTLSLELLKRNRIDERVSELLNLAPEIAGEKLMGGEIDAMLTLNSWESPIVQTLLADDRIEITSFPRADAYVALYPYLNKVVVPRGVGNLAKDLPPADVVLLAPKASLVVRKDLHSAIQYLLLNAAVQIHSGPGIFQHAAQFPAAQSIDVPLSSEANRFYKSGPPFLQNYLPFWMVELVGRLLVLLIPVIGLLYPIIRFLPSFYDWLMRTKIFRLYGELRFLDDTISSPTERDTAAMIAKLDQLEEQADSLKLPAAYASMLYMLRNHIDLVRAKLQKRLTN